jgi:hypothetical protein
MANNRKDDRQELAALSVDLCQKLGQMAEDVAVNAERAESVYDQICQTLTGGVDTLLSCDAEDLKDELRALVESFETVRDWADTLSGLADKLINDSIKLRLREIDLYLEKAIRQIGDVNRTVGSAYYITDKLETELGVNEWDDDDDDDDDDCEAEESADE